MKLPLKMVMVASLLFSVHNSIHAGIFTEMVNGFSYLYAGLAANLGIIAIGKAIAHIWNYRSAKPQKESYIPPVLHKVKKFNSTQEELKYYLTPSRLDIALRASYWTWLGAVKLCETPTLSMPAHQALKHFLVTPIIAWTALSLGNFGFQKILAKLRKTYCTQGSDADNKMAFLGYIGVKLSRCMLAHLTVWAALYKNNLVNTKGLLN